MRFGWSGVAVTVGAWLTIGLRNVTAPRLAWLGAVGMYVAFIAFFLDLFRDNAGVLRWVFAALLALFGLGGARATWKLAESMAGGSRGGESATN